MRFYGINPMLEALRSARIPNRIWIQENKRSHKAVGEIRQLAESRGVPVDVVQDVLPLCKVPEHQGVCAEIADELLVTGQRNVASASRSIMLDGIEDPHNFGAALRVCEGFGFNPVMFQKGNSCGLTPTAVKTSAGAVFHLDLWQVKLNTAVRQLQEEGVTVAILDGSGEATVFDWDLPDRYCLVVGSEGRGVRHAIRRLADVTLRIPMAGRVNSLNLSCALSATLAAFAGRRPSER